VDGAYIFEKSENLENYFKAVGVPVGNMMDSMKFYKMHICSKGKQGLLVLPVWLVLLVLIVILVWLAWLAWLVLTV
jgi:hypothetical protein